METIDKYLNEVLSFHHVAKLSSFTKASESLNISKGQVSKDILRLETFIGAKLLHRTTRKVTLTREGEHLLQYSQKLVELSEVAAKSINQLVNNVGGLIKITSPGSFGNWFIPEIVSILSEEYPDISLEVDLNNAKRDLVEDKIDFALRAMVETNPDMIARFIGHIKDVVVVSKKFLSENKKVLKGVNPLELESVECLIHSHQKKWNTWNFKKGKKDINISIQGRYACSSYTATRLLCLQGNGAARLPLVDVKDDIEKGKLIRIFDQYTISTHPLYLVYPHGGYRTKVQKQFQQFLIGWFKEKKEYFV
ncbi:MAG: LysR family transcriptional regulator [Bacteriovoracaceae bacterium]|nr:LysR family transcriptional regulator [Bacteriovoracaceae bacterium]